MIRREYDAFIWQKCGCDFIAFIGVNVGINNASRRCAAKGEYPDILCRLLRIAYLLFLTQ
jgi:hypothetical protein